MNRSSIRKLYTALAITVSIVIGGCSAPMTPPDSGTPDSGTPDGGNRQCTTFATPSEQLLNAPVASGVTVVPKVPNHPPLDGGLP